MTSCPLRSFQWLRTVRATSSAELVTGCSSSCHLLRLSVGTGGPGPLPLFPPPLHTTLPSPLVLQDGSQVACLVSRGSTGIDDMGASNRAKEEGREAAGLQEGRDHQRGGQKHLAPPQAWLMLWVTGITMTQGQGHHHAPPIALLNPQPPAPPSCWSPAPTGVLHSRISS